MDHHADLLILSDKDIVIGERLRGRIHNDSSRRFPDRTVVSTSRIVAHHEELRIVVTKSGTCYRYFIAESEGIL